MMHEPMDEPTPTGHEDDQWTILDQVVITHALDEEGVQILVVGTPTGGASSITLMGMLEGAKAQIARMVEGRDD